MSRIFLDSNLDTMPPDQMKAGIRTLFNQLEDQINAGADIISLSQTGQALPQGMQRGDLVFNLAGGEIQVGIFNGVDVIYASFGSFTGGITDTQHGDRGGGTLHAVATTLVAGFLSGGDKAKLDRYKGDTTSAAPASTAEYPADGDWGYHTDTVGLTYTLAKNKGGTIFTTVLT